MRRLLGFTVALACLSCGSDVIIMSGAGGAASVASGAAQSSTSAAQSSTRTGSSQASSSSGKQPICGDGVVDGGECCDDGSNNGAPGDPCNQDCTCRPCSSQKIFAGVVSNEDDPTMQSDPPSVGSVWAYNGLKGYQAGVQMCRAIGADHPCDFTEVVAADQLGELAGVPQDLTFWLHRTTNVMDDLQPNTPCMQDSDCNQLAGDAASVCDPAYHLCAFKPGPGGRCDDWTYPTNHLNNGEWFAAKGIAAPNWCNSPGVRCGSWFCDQPGGTMVYRFDRNTAFAEIPPAKGCKCGPTLGCSGPCSGLGNPRAILCCYATCK